MLKSELTISDESLWLYPCQLCYFPKSRHFGNDKFLKLIRGVIHFHHDAARTIVAAFRRHHCRAKAFVDAVDDGGARRSRRDDGGPSVAHHIGKTAFNQRGRVWEQRVAFACGDGDGAQSSVLDERERTAGLNRSQRYLPSSQLCNDGR